MTTTATKLRILMPGWWWSGTCTSHKLKRMGTKGFVRSICGVVFSREREVIRVVEPPGSESVMVHCQRCEALEARYD